MSFAPAVRLRSRVPRRLPAWAASLPMLLLLAPCVQAAPALPPALDTARMCAAVLGLSSPDDADLAECERNEARALRYLRNAYPAVPARVRARCEQLSRCQSKGFGSYAFIQGCLDLK